MLTAVLLPTYSRVSERRSRMCGSTVRLTRFVPSTLTSSR